jgi:hypothetical protein
MCTGPVRAERMQPSCGSLWSEDPCLTYNFTLVSAQIELQQRDFFGDNQLERRNVPPSELSHRHLLMIRLR